MESRRIKLLDLPARLCQQLTIISSSRDRDFFTPPLHLSQIFGENQRPFVVHEVIDMGGEAVQCAEYTGIGRYKFAFLNPLRKFEFLEIQI